MTFDLKKARIGDKVTFQGEIYDFATNLICIKFSPLTSTWVRPEYITTHEPQPRNFKLGDRVMTKDHSYGAIKALSDDFVWVCLDNGQHLTYKVDKIYYIEEGKSA